MHDAMLRLAKFLARRRRFVIAAWLLLVLVSLPLAAKQTDCECGD